MGLPHTRPWRLTSSAVVSHVLWIGLGLAWGEDELLLGWRGESYKPAGQEKPWVEQISWTPRASIIHNLISDAEAQHILDEAWPQMQRSTVVDDETGESVVDDYRTSYGTFLYRFQTPIIETIQRRITLITHLPVENQEDIQILRYANGQYYHEHTDSLDNENPRVATLLIYLSDPTEGGETSFPQTKHWINLATGEKYGLGLSDCAQSHVAFKPHRGDALLFWDYNPDGKTEDPMSSHEGCPVTKGVKWTTTTWIHSLPFNGQEWNGTHFTRALSADAFKDPGWCRDVHRRCPGWAKNGECEKNAKFMKGSNSDGKCPASCGVCIPCDPEDMECYNNNRRAMNYVAFNPGEMTWRDFKDAVQEKR